MEWAGLGKITENHTVPHGQQESHPRPEGQGANSTEGAILWGPSDVAVAFSSQFTALQGGSQGNTQPKLTVLYLQISCWCYPLAEPNWKPEARAPGCSSFRSASWSTEQGEGWRTDLGGDVQDSTCLSSSPQWSQVQIFSQKAELEIPYVV